MNNSDEIQILPYDPYHKVSEEEKNLINELFPEAKSTYLYNFFLYGLIVAAASIIYSDVAKKFFSKFFPKETIIFLVSICLLIFICVIKQFEEK